MSTRKSAAGGSKPLHSNPAKIFVGNISYRITEDELSEFFSKFGRVARSTVVRDHKKGWSRGIGFVTFEQVASAESALSASEDELILDGRCVRVSTPLKPKRQKAMEELLAQEHGQPETSRPGNIQGEDVQTQDSVQLPSPVLNASGVDFSRLNDDILFHVFSYLTLRERITVERVSKAWQRTANRWWKQVKSLHFRNIFVSFRGKYGGLTDEILHSVLKRGCRELRTIDLSASAQCLTDYSCDLIGMYCPRLERLDMSRVATTQHSFKQLAQKCTRIKWLNVSGCGQIGEKCLWWGLHHLKALEHLNSSRNRRINGQCFYVAGSNLQTVILRECDKLVDVGVAYLTVRSPNLQVLDLSHCQQLTGASVLSISTNCSSLREFQFSGPNCIVTNRDLMGITKLTKLEVLVLDRLPCGDELLVAMARACHALRVLSVAACYDITDNGLESLSRLPNLVDLNCSYSNVKSDSWLLAISRVGALQRLVAKACLSVTDQGLSSLAEHCLGLQELDVSSCYYVTSKALYPLQESLLYMRGEDEKSFSITVGGTEIPADVALKFAEVTGASLCLQDLSNQTLLPEYPFLCPSMENWDDDDEPGFEAPNYAVGGHLADEDDMEGRAEDYLINDDPALFSDDSGPEGWDFG